MSRNILADTMTMLGVNYCIIPFLGRGKGLVLSRKFPGEVWETHSPEYGGYWRLFSRGKWVTTSKRLKKYFRWNYTRPSAFIACRGTNFLQTLLYFQKSVGFVYQLARPSSFLWCIRTWNQHQVYIYLLKVRNVVQ